MYVGCRPLVGRRIDQLLSFRPTWLLSIFWCPTVPPATLWALSLPNVSFTISLNFKFIRLRYSSNPFLVLRYPTFLPFLLTTRLYCSLFCIHKVALLLTC
jgi:hypothetical protein